ncbi:MAG: homoserine kinase [Candidatus Caldarchaeum sp.]|nr:homoserine kinase [Candidatus Caldarchaeum sp.]
MGVFISPASSANIGPGFDVFAIALEKPSLKLEVDVEEGEGVTVEVEGPYRDEIPTDPSLNAAGKAAQQLLQSKRIKKSIRIALEASIPPRKGLGASGAEAAAAVYALNKLLGLGLTDDEMVMAAAAAEPGNHADNVSASLLGGFVVCLRDRLGLKVVSIPPPSDLGLVVIVPDIRKESTEAARKAVPSSVEMSVHVEVASKVAAASAAVCLGDVGLFLRSVVFDPLVECSRADAGVYGVGVTCRKLLEEKRVLFERYGVAEVVSGAGPSRLLLFDRKENKQEVGRRKIDEAVAELIRRLEESGTRILETIETRPSMLGCRQIV